MDWDTKNIVVTYGKNTSKINISNKNIVGILDLSSYKKLKELDCSNNSITQIINLNPDIVSINCSNNLVTKLYIPNKVIKVSFESNPLEELYYPLEKAPPSYPDTLKKITFGSNYTDDVDNLPKSLTHLILGAKFNHSLTNLPNGLIYLEISSKYSYTIFDQSIDNLPPHLTHLILPTSFKHPIDNLPSSLLYLKFEQKSFIKSEFNHPINNLPHSLTLLILPNEYNHPIEYLPNSLEHLEFGEEYNHPLHNLPPNLTYLKFGYNFSQPIEYLPPNLIYLVFGYNYNQLIDINIIPESLTHIELILKYIPKDDYRYYTPDISSIPQYITHLYLGYKYNGKISNLPKSLKNLCLDIGNEKKIDDIEFLSNLTHLKILDMNYDEKIEKFPHSLTHLELPQFYNYELDNLPPNLTNLTFNDLGIYDKPLTNLPNSLTHLILPYDYHIEKNLLPPNIKFLKMGKTEEYF